MSDPPDVLSSGETHSPSCSNDRLLAIGYRLFAQRWLFLITGTGGNTMALA